MAHSDHLEPMGFAERLFRIEQGRHKIGKLNWHLKRWCEPSRDFNLPAEDNAMKVKEAEQGRKDMEKEKAQLEREIEKILEMPV